MALIDTHSHIYVEEFDTDRVEIIERAEKESVTKILLPAIDSESHIRMLATEEQFPTICSSMMGVHPCSIKENYQEELRIAKEYLEKRPFIAVGEIGLDFYWDKTFAEQQFEAFNQQIEWALHYAIPIVIHSREATEDCINVIKKHQKGNLRGVFHCFSGSEVQAKKLVELGFHLGIGGVVTYKNAGLPNVLQSIPLTNLLLETDAPYLSPVPFRGKRNEPSYLRYIVQKLAEAKNCSIDEIETITTLNAKKLFFKK